MMKMHTILLLVALGSAFLIVFVLNINSGFTIIFTLIGGISVLTGFTIGVHRSVRWLKGSGESNKNQNL